MLLRFRVPALAWIAVAGAWGQIGGGSIVGTVRDPSGAPVTGAKVQAHHEETNEERLVKTNAEGYYEFPLLAPGHYRLLAEAVGFEKQHGAVFELAAGTRPRIDLTLQVGSITETVEVKATVPLINTTTTDLGVVMARERIDELPLNGRNFEDLVELQAGVVNAPGSSAGARGGISFHGSTALGTNVLLDGVDMSFGEVNGTASFTSAGGPSTLVNTVSVEAVEQFKSTANAYSAEYGRAGGGVLNVTTRSGTNQFHGTLFEFFRNDKLNANDFFSNKNALGKTPLRWNQYGANFGGPIKRDRLFFFVNWEGARVKRQAQVTGNVATPALLATVKPAMREILSLLPTTFTPSSSIYVGTHIRDDRSTNRDDTLLARVDGIAGAHRLALRDSYNNQDYTSPNLQPSMPTVYPIRFNNVMLEDSLMLGPTAFNELRLGFNRVDLNRSPLGYRDIPASLSAGGVATSLSNYIHFLPTTYTIADNFTLIRGSHSVKIGLELREVRSVRDQGGPPSYSYNSITDLIADKPNTVGLSFGGSKGLRTLNTGFYVQDDWRVSKSLQINMGVRYEYSPPLKGGFNVQGSDPFGPFLKAQQPMFASDRNDFAPRLGIVWTPGGKQRTVVRAGGGISYVMPQAIFYYDMAYINPALPGVASLTAADVPAQYLLFPNVTGFQSQVQANPSLLPPTFRLSRSVADHNRRDTYVGMWNLAIQQQLTSTLAVQAAYVGQRTVKLISVRPLNLVDPATGLRQDPTLGQINFEENAARIAYHAMEVSVNQRLWRHLNYDTYFTWSKTLGYYTPDNTITFTGGGLQDPLNIAASNGPVEGAPGKAFKNVFSYALPGAGIGNKTLRTVAGGWTLRGIIGCRSGLPVNVTSGADLAGNGRSAGQRPDAVYGIDPYAEDHNTQMWLNPAAFSTTAVRAQKRFGNLGYNALIGPSAFSMDAGLHKTFAITEHQRMTVRIESFNTLNHTVFNNPTAATNNVNFGRSLSARSPRAYQLALKYVF
ncbi:MAG TPA: TonB-dependent receptor [Candidatus Solibacter sp.]|nr:TonB-dependent receptor [Candidatus Solibacter sp.]